MADLIEAVQWEATIYQLETTDPVKGGNDGISNRQAKQLANRTAYLKRQVELKAPLASPNFTGVPAVPTAVANTSTAQVASTAFVIGQAATVAPIVDGVATVGASKKFSREDHVHPVDTKAAPPGEVAYFAMSSAPSGWLKANGAAISRTTYSALFAAIGTTFGAGDGSTTFNVPDLRGEFIRGFDDSRGVDSGHSLGGAQSAYAGSITLSIGTYTVNPGTTAVITDSVTMNGVIVGGDSSESKTINVTPGDSQGASTLCSLINQRTIEHDNRHSNLLSSVYFVGLAHRIHSA